MPASTQIKPFLVRGALVLRKVSVPKIARRHGAAVSTCYAALNGTRPGNDPKVRKAVKEMRAIAQEVLGG